MSSVKDLNNLFLGKTLALTARALAPLLICCVGIILLWRQEQWGGQFPSLGHSREPHGDAGCLHLPLLGCCLCPPALRKARNGNMSSTSKALLGEIQAPGGHLSVQPGCPQGQAAPKLSWEHAEIGLGCVPAAAAPAASPGSWEPRCSSSRFIHPSIPWAGHTQTPGAQHPC